MEDNEVVEVVKNFMHHAAFNLINSAETNNPELMWAVLTNTRAMIDSYTEAMSKHLESMI